MKLTQYALILLLSCEPLHAALRTNGSPQQSASTSEVTWANVDWRAAFLLTTKKCKDDFFENPFIQTTIWSPDDHFWLEKFSELPVALWNLTPVPTKTQERLLSRALKYGYMPAIQLLLKHRDINQLLINHNSKDPAISIAVIYGHIRIVTHLLNSGADVSVSGESGNAPLHHAADRNALDIITLLLLHGANINMQNNHGNTPLHYATGLHGKPETVQFLISKGASIDIQNDDGNTPLFTAIINNNAQTVKTLLQNNASTIILNQKDETPLSLAKKRGYTEIVQLLTGHTPHEQ